MTLRTPELDSNLMGVELCPRLSLRNSISYFDHSTKVLAFIPPSLSSQGEHIDYKFSVLLPAPVFNNDIRRVCPLFIYLVIWAPKDYIADTFLWNHIAFMTRESKVQKQRPVGLDDPIDKGIVLDTTCFSISRDIRAFENPEYESQKPRPAGQNENRAQATSAEGGFQRSENPSLETFSVNSPKLEISDLREEFNLESFPFLEDINSYEGQDSSKVVSEMTMSFVEALALAPSEPRLMEKEIEQPLVQSSADLEFARSEDSTGNFSMGDYSWLGPMLATTVECSLHRLKQSYQSDYGWNENYGTRMVQTSRRCDRGSISRSSGQLPCPSSLLGRSQSLNHAIIPPMTDEREFGQEVHDPRENLWSMTSAEPGQGPDKYLGANTRINRVLLHSADLRHHYKTYSAMTKDLPT